MPRACAGQTECRAAPPRPGRAQGAPQLRGQGQDLRRGLRRGERERAAEPIRALGSLRERPQAVVQPLLPPRLLLERRLALAAAQSGARRRRERDAARDPSRPDLPAGARVEAAVRKLLCSHPQQRSPHAALRVLLRPPLLRLPAREFLEPGGGGLRGGRGRGRGRPRRRRRHRITSFQRRDVDDVRRAPLAPPHPAGRLWGKARALPRALHLRQRHAVPIALHAGLHSERRRPGGPRQE
mmetsp:Transcript_4768/g.12016  ORF Transcript_4768/g.12016 Transcript_4768/m.12016 type:complete len:240 (-) Transcript_4768:283-1002(-)